MFIILYVKHHEKCRSSDNDGVRALIHELNKLNQLRGEEKNSPLRLFNLRDSVPARRLVND